jgi:hypothetical protein
MFFRIFEQSRSGGSATRYDRVVLLALASLACVTARAHAGATVRVPEGCGSERELQQGVEQLAGAGARIADPLELAIAWQAEHGPFELRLLLGSERRVLHDPDCATLFRSALVMVAAASAADGREAAAPSKLASEHSAWRATASVGGGATLGVVPDVGARLELAFAIERGAWGAQLGGYTLLPRTAQPSAAGPGVVVRSYGMRAGVSWIPLTALRALAGVELGYMHGSTVHAAAPGAGGAWALAGVIEASARILRFGPGFVDVVLSGSWAWVRPQFEVAGFGVVQRMSRFGGSAIARVGWSIF